jgi:hypothetical protein
VFVSTIQQAGFDVVNSGAGRPLAGATVRVNGNRPLLAALNDPAKDGLEDELAAGSAAVTVNELTSAVPERLETSSAKRMHHLTHD